MSADVLTANVLTAKEAVGGSEVGPFATADGYLALDLTERLSSLRRHGPPPDAARLDEETAERRLQRWRAQPPFDDDDVWRRRLAADGMGERELRILLGEPPEALRERSETPPWLVEIERAYSAAAEPFAWPAGANVERTPFLPFVEPLIQAAYERLVARAEGIARCFPDAPFDAADAAQALVGHLPDLLAPMLNRVLVVELHAARLEERLAGETSEERFEDFAARLRRRDVALEILGRYPVLARRLVERVGQWETTGAEFLGHLAADGAEIRERFAGGGDPGKLIETRGAVSDPHRGGRSVLLLRFDSGLRLVYKPKSLAIEVAFQALLAWVNARGFEPAFRTLQVLDAGDHGWVEFVEPAPCRSADEVGRFYQRQGGYLALLYLLDGTDFHYENLIAAGEHPMLVDLETLFQPWVAGRALHGADRLLGASLRATVLRSNMLPSRSWGTRENAGIDISGLASRGGQLTPQPVLATAERGTDQMRVERRRVEIPASENRPRLADREISLVDQATGLDEGFRRLYRLLERNRPALLAPDGPLARFRDVEMRVLFRPTASYGALQLESFHPHVLGNELERQRLLDRLWSGVEHRPFLERLIPAELHDLLRGDVPIFLTRPGSRDLWTSRGERLEGFLEESGLERVERRLAEGWTPQDMARQRSLIRDSLETLRLADDRVQRTTYTFRERAEPASRDELLAAARRTGDLLVERAFRGPEEAMWMTLDYREPDGWRLAPTGPDVYMGLPGIALALSYLGELVGESEWTEVARHAVVTQTRQLDDDPSLLEGIGAFSGWGGVIYALTHLGVLWRDEPLLDLAQSYAEGLATRVADDDVLDVIGGSAGALLALFVLAGERPSERLVATAHACGERLLATAEPQKRGVGWVMPRAGNRPLAGMSHGAAGIALALLRLAAETGDERYRRVALEGLEFERGLFSAAHRNWPDLRVGADAEPGIDETFGHDMCAWCHGAPGVGLARLAGLPYLDDATVREEIAVAVAKTLDDGFGRNHSLCHGDLGNLDFLLEAARVLGDDELLATVYRRAGGVVAGLEREGWQFGLAGNVETPSLMVGLAGIGYGLARLAAPDSLPCLLALAPPPESRRRELSERRPRGRTSNDPKGGRK